jgi:hypothetical protein
MTERNSRWRDTSRLVIGSYWSVSHLGHAILPYAVTKQEQWRLILTYLDARVERLGGYTETRKARTRGRYVDRLYTGRARTDRANTQDEPRPGKAR